MSDILPEIMEESSGSAVQGKYLVLSLGEQQYAIAIEYVVDIINVQPITRVPNCPHFIMGITNLRGKAIPTVDLRLRFGKEPQEYTDRTCIIVLEDLGAAVGLIVDSVAEVIDLDDDQIAPPPSFNQSFESRFIQGVGKAENGMKLILDCKTVLDDNRLNDSSENDDY